MRWNEGNIWKTRIQFDTADKNTITFEYKYIRVTLNKKEYLWEECFNRQFSINIAQLMNSGTNKYYAYYMNNSNDSIYFVVDILDSWNQTKPQQKVVKSVAKSEGRAMIVLGKKLLPDGKPAEMLKTRMEFAANLFKQIAKEHDDIMVVTGGKVQGPNVESEAVVMKSLAVSFGVPESKIIQEDFANNTIENVLRTQELLVDRGITKLIVVTADFHMERTKKIFEALLDHVKYQMTFHEDHPILSEDEKKNEQEVEKYMMSQLQQHLSYYIT